MICIINCGTTCLEEIKEKVALLNYAYKIVDFDDIKNTNFLTFSGIIISGSPTKLTKVNLQEYLDIFKFIKTVNIPILGICFGHQIMGLVYRARVYKGRNISKKEKIEIVKEDDLFDNIKNNSAFQEDHSEFIDLPNEFMLLAKSKTCKNEAMKHKRKQLYGLQFHPEISNDNGEQLFRNFLNLCS